MNWKGLLEGEIHYAYGVADKMLDLVDESQLDWKPATGENWMTTGQLAQHIATACGGPIRGFVTGDWGLSPDVDVEKMSPEEMLPPAEALPSAESIADVKRLLADDKKIALDALAQCSEEKLATEPAPAPWDPSEMILGQRLLGMVNHLNQHKAQLFYYLKLQGKQVDTSHLWGM
jgi:hypothetical protein